LEGTSGGRNSPDSKEKQEEQFSQSLVQWDSEHLQGWRLYNLSGQPVPVFDHTPCKKDVGFVFFLYLKMEFSVFQFVSMIEKHWSKQKWEHSKCKN